MLKKGEICLGYVERVDFPGKGIITVSGEEETVTVKRVVPEQTVFFRVNKKRKGRAEGELLSVRDKSPDEVTPDCPHFGACGSCIYRQLNYGAQLKLKEEQVKRILDRVYINRGEEPDYNFEGIYKPPEVLEYRNKMEYSFGDEVKDGPLTCGLHKYGSHYDIVTATDCKIVDRDFRFLLEESIRFFKDRGVTYYHKNTGEGYLRHLLVRKSKETGDILIALVTTGNYLTQSGDTDKKNEEELLKDYTERILHFNEINSLNGQIAGVIHVINDGVADVIKADSMDILYGKDHFFDRVLGLWFKITLFSFFQTNTLGAEVLYDRVRRYAESADSEFNTVYDLYCGTGTISQILASVSKKVIGVEIVEEAVEAAKLNAIHNKLENCEFIAGDVLKVLDDLTEKPDLIVLDPPRDGVNPKALKKILDLDVNNIIYVSCKPTSLARDLDIMLDSGYKVMRTCTIDLFPGTAHFESCVLLERVSNRKIEKNVSKVK